MALFNLTKDNKFYHGIKKEDYLKIQPTSGTSANKNQSGDILFEIAQSSSILDICNSLIYFSIEIKDSEETITLENNFFPRLFSEMTLKLGGTEIERIKYPGEISTMLNLVLLNENFKNTCGDMMTWIPDNMNENNENIGEKKRKNIYKSKLFEGFFPLRYLFGFLQCYGRVVYLLSIDLILNRKMHNDKEIFYGTTTKNWTEIKMNLQIKDLEFWIPQLKLNPDIEIDIIKQIKNTEEINVTFLKRLTANLNTNNESIFVWTPFTCANKIRFLFIGFKNEENKYSENNALFIQSKEMEFKDPVDITKKIKKVKRITNIQVQVKDVYYPVNPLEFDITKNKEVLPYSYYINVCNLFSNSTQLNILDWQNLYSIFCFDLTAQENEIVNQYPITIHVKKDPEFKPVIYVVALEEKLNKINIIDGKMANVI